MEILKSSKFFWKYRVGLYLSEDSTILSSLISALLNVFLLIGDSILIWGSFALFYYESDRLSSTQMMFAFLQIVCNSSAEMIYIFYCTQKVQLAKLINEFQGIVSRRYSRFSGDIYERAEWKVDLLVKWHCLMTFISICGVYIVVLIVYLVRSLTRGEINVHTWPNMVQYKSVYQRPKGEEN